MAEPDKPKGKKKAEPEAPVFEVAADRHQELVLIKWERGLAFVTPQVGLSPMRPPA
jgi:hypothetical protein